MYEKVSETNIIPRNGIFLGLDISRKSSGLCLYVDGKKKTGNKILTVPETEVHREVLLRRELKKGILDFCYPYRDFDVICVEDVFEGINPKGTRTLFALNTAIDELILDKEITCKSFNRVNNKAWKKWLFVVDSDKKMKGFDDKLRIQYCLKELGVEEEGEGYQDRLDSTGMLIGYFLHTAIDKDEEKKNSTKKKQIKTLTGVSIYYTETKEELMEKCRSERVKNKIEEQEVKDNVITKALILNYLRDNYKLVYVTGKIHIGIELRKALKDELPVYEDGGYLGFWLSDKKLSRMK